MDKFICDGCGKKYPIEESVDVNAPNLAGIVMCKNCIASSKAVRDEMMKDYKGFYDIIYKKLEAAFKTFKEELEDE